ncbi:hypothetical protein F8O01_09475 [Pseudoclavibacter chungangensis]|uniref:Uncharacterized protein n=1 Tax=Pseudoclavibacter chungangensis TaxID=587635 RepID=A0A7J5BRI6_9MICO|nr:hypothetical protein F8O01_09475 [Pseudoclavibacter chungangensis]
MLPRAVDVVTTRRGLERRQVNPTLWRITRRDGAVVGYVEHLQSSARPFRAKRMNADRRGFTSLGDFDDFEDAFDVLRR